MSEGEAGMKETTDSAVPRQAATRGQLPPPPRA